MNNIKKFRLEQGYKLEHFARLCNLSNGYISHLECGRRSNPSYDTMKKIAATLNKTISEVFEEGTNDDGE